METVFVTGSKYGSFISGTRAIFFLFITASCHFVNVTTAELRSLRGQQHK
jgi:hypothetical protein